MIPELSGPWAMREPDLRSCLRSVRDGLAAAHGGLLDRPAPALSTREGHVTIIPVRGVLQRSGNLISLITGSSTFDGIASGLRAALADRDTRGIVLDVDSPGGDALGLAELSDAIVAARDERPVVAVVRGLGASAAFLIASSASEVVVAKEAIVGGVGTVLTMLDFTEADKQAGIEEIEIVSSQSPRKRPDPKTDEGREQLQEEVDSIAQVFVESVARNRGVSVETVLSDFGQGGVFVGEEAVTAGLADRVGTLDQILVELGAGETGGGGAPEVEVVASWEALLPRTEEQILDAWRQERAERRRGGERMPDLGGGAPTFGLEARRYLNGLEREGVEINQAVRLVGGDQELAAELGLRTPSAERRAEAAERRRRLAAREADDEDLPEIDPEHPEDETTEAERHGSLVKSAGDLAERAGLIR